MSLKLGDFGWSHVVKIIRFARIYGPLRTWYKIAGRLRLRSFLPRSTRSGRGIGIIGCGQFAFATIGYYLMRQKSANVLVCFDLDSKAASSFARFHRVPHCTADAESAIGLEEVDLIYIASNHASHSSYAIQALENGKAVYVEKPIAVSHQQLAKLSSAVRHNSAKIYAGYNRPFSGAIRDFRKLGFRTDLPITYSCFISGHKIEPNHWYRDSHEGTRICGNVGHWLDLLIHMLSWGRLPDNWRIDLSWSDVDSRDDNLAVNLVSERGDLANIVLTSRSEPFEGISETINIQWGDCIAQIDDFRRLTVYQGERKIHRRYWPKDVGHRDAIQQPFRDLNRDWKEVENSTLIMLEIADMVRRRERTREFSFAKSHQLIEAEYE